MNNKTKTINFLLFILILPLFSCGQDSGLAPTYEGIVADTSTEYTGDKRIFVTDTAYTGNLGGSFQADTKCNSDANKPSGTGPSAFMAMIADNFRHACTSAGCSGGVGENSLWVLDPDTAYVRVDGTVIGTTDSSGIFPGLSLDNAITTDPVDVWTGIEVDWTRTATDCSSWSNVGIDIGVYGSGNVDTIIDLLDTGFALCSELKRIVCVEQ